MHCGKELPGEVTYCPSCGKSQMLRESRPVQIASHSISSTRVGKPSTVVILLIVGGAFYIIGGIVAAFVVGALSAVLTGLGAEKATAGAQQAMTAAIATGFISGGAIIVGAVLANTGSKTKVRVGAIVAIVFGIIGIGNTFGGLILGFVLTIAGGILALIWKPKQLST